MQRQRCAHCKLPVRGRRTQAGRDEADSLAGPYCCTGCCMAAQIGRGEASSSAQLLARVVLGAFLSMGVMVVSLALYGGDTLGAGQVQSEAAAALDGLYRLAALALSVPVALLIGVPLARAVLQTRNWLSVDMWILTGAGAALLLSTWNTLITSGPVYFETATMILVLVGLGRWIDVRAKERARDRLMQVLPETHLTACRVSGANEESIPAPDLQLGDLVRVRPGEVVPVDGEVRDGRSFIDTVDLTGESAPRSVGPGEQVLAGSKVLDGALLVCTSAAVGARVCDEMERLLERAMTAGGTYERRAERIATVMVPSVLALASGVFIHGLWVGDLERAVGRALSVMLVACPCALGIATPLAFWSALARTWERHVLVKGSGVLERLARIRRVLFDKTGTLTTGRLELAAVHSLSSTEPFDEREILRLAAAAEVGSEHPIGVALRGAWHATGSGELPSVRNFRATPGVGVAAEVEGRRVTLESCGPQHERAFTTVAMQVDDQDLALFELRDRPRAEAAATLDELRRRGLELRVLSGDARGPVEALGAELALDVEWALLPHQKVERLQALGGTDALFVGDGMNDAAVLAEASVGVAMHGGSPRSFEAADVLLLAPGLGPLPALIELARIAVRTARFNLAWCLAYNLVGICLAITGTLTPLLAACAMVLSGLGVVANTARAFARFDREDTKSSSADYALRPGREGEPENYSLAAR
ncbi:MAG: heavy metal translocating P-type ATPase [Chlamydiales bacterium]|jgi:heavy metal translocating P-type ATPase